MTGTSLTVRPPLTPPDCDLRDFGHMPLDVRKFRDSDLVAVEDPEAIVAAIMLWGAAWHQIPAASLPDDDRVLANLAGYGIRSSGVAAWKKIRSGALRGFVKCSDGRLYHPLVADKAKSAWEGKLKQRWRTFCATIRKHNERNPNEKLTAPEYENWLDLGRPDKVAELRVQTTSAGPLFDSQQDENVTRDNADTSHATDGCSHADEQRDMPSKGKGERKGEGEGEGDSYSFDNVHGGDLVATTKHIASAASVSLLRRTALERETKIVEEWLKLGASVPETILPTIVGRLRSMAPSETVSSLAYFDSAVRKAHALASGRSRNPPAKAVPLKVRDTGDPRVEQFRERLREAVGPRTYDGWLAPNVAAFALNGTSLKVTTASPFNRDWVDKHFRSTLASVAEVERVEVIAQ